LMQMIGAWSVEYRSPKEQFHADKLSFVISRGPPLGGYGSCHIVVAAVQSR
jgi:hypothetical protein